MKNKNGFRILSSNEPLKFEKSVKVVGTRPSQSGRTFKKEVFESVKNMVVNDGVSFEPEEASIRYIYPKEEIFVEDKINEVKRSKTIPDLFGPLKKTKVEVWRMVINNVFPHIDITKVPATVVGILKNYGYIKMISVGDGNLKKFIPNTNELVDIICAGYVYHIAKETNTDVQIVISKIEKTIIGGRRVHSDILDMAYKIQDLINIVENYNLNQLVEDEFNHYDIRVKYLRCLKFPNLDNLLLEILEAIKDASLNIKGLESVKIKGGRFKRLPDEEFQKGLVLVNMIKKYGIRYINSRSNLEWYFYGTTLKKIRNFLGRDKNSKFMGIIIDAIRAFKVEQVNLGEHMVNVYENIEILHKYLEKAKSQREKRFNKDKN